MTDDDDDDDDDVDVGMFRMLVVWMKIRESCCCGWEMTHAADNAHTSWNWYSS